MKKFFVFIATLLTLSSFAQTKLELAEQAMDNNDYATAIQYTTEHLKGKPKDVKAYIMRSAVYYHQQQMAAALVDAGLAIKYAKKKGEITLANAYDYRGMLYEHMEEYVLAEADYSKAVKLSPKDPETYALRGEFYYKTGLYAYAEADYRMASKLDAMNADYTVELARCLLAQDKYLEARVLLKSVVKLFPKNEEAFRLYALALLYQGEYKSFTDNYIRYMDMASNPSINPLIDASKHEYVYVLQQVTNMVQTSENHRYWMSVRIRVYRENKQYDEALKDIRTLESLMEDTIVNLFLLNQAAECHEALYNFSESAKYFSRMIDYLKKIHSEDAILYLKRSEVYFEMGEYHKALADCDYSLSLTLDYAGFAYNHRGWIHEFSGDNDAAMEDYNRSLKFDSTYAYSYLMRGEHYLFYKKDTLRAMEDFESVLHYDTLVQDGSCRHYALMFLGKKDEAKQWMQQIIDAEPDEAGHYYDAACLYARMDEKGIAINYLRQAFEHGYRAFHHIEEDDDLDSIRNLQEFKDLINEYRKEKIQNIFNRLP